VISPTVWNLALKWEHYIFETVLYGSLGQLIKFDFTADLTVTGNLSEEVIKWYCLFMIVYNNDADFEVSDTCVRNSLLSWVELRYIDMLLKFNEKAKKRYMYVLHGSALRADINNIVQKNNYDYKLWLFLHDFLDAIRLYTLGLFFNPKISGLGALNPGISGLKMRQGSRDCNPYWRANNRQQPIKTSQWLEDCCCYLLYMRMSGVQISLDGSRMLFTPSNSLSFHDNL